jgi:hypothetical protein
MSARTSGGAATFAVVASIAIVGLLFVLALTVGWSVPRVLELSPFPDHVLS